MLTWVRFRSRFKISINFHMFGVICSYTGLARLRLHCLCLVLVIESLVVRIPQAKFEEWYSAMATRTKSTNVGVLEVANHGPTNMAHQMAKLWKIVIQNAM